LGSAQLTRAGREIHLKAGQKIVIEAGIELTLKAGGSFVKLDPGGITISGPLARINAGGAPAKGSGLAIKSPLLPGMADSDEAGQVLEQARPGESTRTPKRKRALNFSGEAGTTASRLAARKARIRIDTWLKTHRSTGLTRFPAGGRMLTRCDT